MLHGVKMDGGVQGAWHGIQMGTLGAKQSNILPPARGRRICRNCVPAPSQVGGFFGEAVFHGIKQPTQVFERLE
jgi:hypothetical protein